MSVDKIGRYESTVNTRREAQRTVLRHIGFRLTEDGHCDMENKKVRNMGKPVAANDAAPSLMHRTVVRCCRMTNGTLLTSKNVN